jgi:hypothetical protein
MYVKVIENLPVAGRIIVDNIENRSLVQFIRAALPEADENVITTNHILLYNIVTKGSGYTYERIYTFRNVIPPVYWFYTEDEKDTMPEPVPFKAKHPVSDIGTIPTIALQYFEDMKSSDKYAIREYCEIHNLDYLYFRNFIDKKQSKGIRVFKNRPSAKIIKELRDEIHPDKWFIYPDELKKKKN